MLEGHILEEHVMGHVKGITSEEAVERLIYDILKHKQYNRRILEWPFLHGEIDKREDFGHLLNERNLVYTAVEIGTHRGDFAKSLLDTWKGRRLICVDPYTEYLTIDSDRESDYTIARSVLGDKAEILRKTSEEAAQWMRERGYKASFVYIDGDHTQVYKDLNLWWDLVHQFGIIAGHDVICHGEIVGGWGRFIKPDVERFCIEKKCMCHLVGPTPYSFYIYKLEGVL
jgi:hypothetical protein